MPFCENCGKPTYPLDTVCASCGTPVKQPARPVATPAPTYTNVADVEPPQGSPYAVLSSWAFVGTLLLMLIPIAGFILTIVWAAGSTTNLNRRNLARANLLIMGIVLALYIFAIIAVIAIGGSTYFLNDLIQ